MKPSLSVVFRLPRRWSLPLALAVSFPGQLWAQSSIWIASAPNGSLLDWNVPSNWDTGIAPNGSSAVAIFNRLASGSSNQPGLAPVAINSAVTLSELRYDVPVLPTTGNPARIHVGAPGSLRLEGPGIAVGLSAIAEISVQDGGLLEFANSATVLIAPSSTRLLITGRNAAVTPSRVVFRDNSSAGSASFLMPSNNTLTFLDNSSAGQAEINALSGTPVIFSNQSRAGTAQIFTSSTVVFEDTASADNSRLTASASGVTGTSGRIIFKDNATAANASITLSGAESSVDLSGMVGGNPTALPATGRALLANPGSASAAVTPNDRGAIAVNAVKRALLPNSLPTAIYLGGTTLIVGLNNDDIVSFPRVLERGGLYGSSAGEILVGGGLTKRGTGVLQISETNNYSGLTVIDQGELRLLGGTISRTRLQPSGRLTGTGSITGNVDNVFGRIAPGLATGFLREELSTGAPQTVITTTVAGSQIGTLSIAGNFLQQSGISAGNESTLSIDLAGATDFDRLVISGSASLGGVLELGLTGGYAPSGTTTYSFLSAGSVAGTFDRIALRAGWGVLFNPTIVYTSTGVSVRIQQRAIADLGTTPGEQALGQHLDQTLNSAAEDERDLSVILFGFNSDAEVTSALQSLSPDRYGVLPEAGFISALQQQLALDRHLAQWRENARSGLELYFDASYRRRAFSSVAGVPESSFKTSGGSAGGAWRNGSWTAGAQLAYETTKGKLDAIGSEAEVKSINPMLFVQYDADRFFFNGSAGFSRDDYELLRKVEINSVVQTATASPKGRRSDFSSTAGYTLTAGGWAISPALGLLYSAWRMDDFSEAGAAGTNMAFSSWSTSSWRSRAGVELKHGGVGSIVVPRISVLWWHEFHDDRAFTAQFMGANSGYVSPGRPATKNIVQAGLSLDAKLGTNAVLSMGVESIWGSSLKAEPSFSGGVRWAF
ncbi:MAG: autotransporter domain-containing protein [Opitutaceae bacterium]